MRQKETGCARRMITMKEKELRADMTDNQVSYRQNIINYYPNKQSEAETDT